jgi:8-oxo-dGTP pyrophosphatase MutT (NUDIX family)
MRIVTLIFLVRENEVLLAMKKRGFGVGKLNGYGGKLADGETVEESAVREVKEESGVDIQESDLEKLGELDFYFDDKPEWNQKGIIYKVRAWKGEPVETEEMKPEWFSVDAIPYEQMWIDDPLWYPYFLNDQKFAGEIHFGQEGKTILSSNIHTI